LSLSIQNADWTGELEPGGTHEKFWSVRQEYSQQVNWCLEYCDQDRSLCHPGIPLVTLRIPSVTHHPLRHSAPLPSSIFSVTQYPLSYPPPRSVTPAEAGVNALLARLSRVAYLLPWALILPRL
jgi:hypothetical protein